MRKSTPYIVAALLALGAAGTSRAQTSLGESLGEFYSYGDRYFLEVVTLPGAAGRARAVVPFRLAHDLLTFRRVSGSSNRTESFVATPELYVEAVASDGVIADRALWRDTVSVGSFSLTNAKDRFVPGVVELALRPGVYRFRYVLADEGPGSGMSEETPPVRIDDFGSPSPAIGMPLFLHAAGADTLAASVIGSSAAFGERLRVYVPLAGASAGGTLRYDLLTRPSGEGAVGRTLQSGIADIRTGQTLGRAVVGAEAIGFPLVRDTAQRTAAALIDARIDDLSPGEYQLLLSYGAEQGAVTDTVRFRVRWIDQPVSLSKASYAIRTLYPIASDETISAMLEGGAEAQTRALERFWEERDPTPATEYNEAMAEYYRRVDYALFNFRSIGQKDGAFTDRGKVYMLYGAPTSVDRRMQPNADPREVWTYRLARQGETVMSREFIFVDESKTGAYRLVEYHDL